MFFNAGNNLNRLTSYKLNSDSNKEYQEGHITIFLSLMLTLVLSIVCTSLESARVQGAIMQLQNITDLGVFSVFGEYYNELLDMYDLFFLDTSYGTDEGSAERVDIQIKDYMDYNINANKGLPLVKNADLWRIADYDVKTSKYVYATDSNGAPVFNQAVEYMKHKIGLSMAQELLGFYENDIDKKQEEYKSELEDNSNEMSSVDEAEGDYLSKYEESLNDENNGEDEDEKEELPPPPDIENPIDFINSIKTEAILKLVVKDYENISDEEVKLNSMPSKRNLKKGDGSISKGDINDVLSNVLFNEYVFEKFPNALSKNLSYGLKYQIEYILCGKSSDKKNLEGAVNKLLLIREGINFAYLLSDTVKREEAFTLAAALVGYLGVPAFIIIVQGALLLSWAFAESVIEVRALLSGKKVPLIKNSSNWNLSLSNLSNLKNELDSSRNDSDGLDYEQYLKILVYTQKKSKKVCRAIDMIEYSIREKNKNKNFKIDNCTQEFNTNVNFNINNVFMSMPFRFSVKNAQGFRYSINKYYKY